MSLPSPLNVVIEQAIESLLRLDPDTRERLQSVDGKLILLKISAPTMTLALSISAGRVYVVGGVEDSAADTIISGSLGALRSLAGENDALYSGEVRIDGDLHTGQQIRDIINGVDPDWEELVSPLLGDTLTHRLSRAGQQLSGWLERTRLSLHQNASEYLQEESEMLAPSVLVREHLDTVDDVRAAAERLEARVKRLERLSRSDSATC